MLLRRSPLATAIPRRSAGGLKPKIGARVCTTRPSCYRAKIVNDRVYRADLGRPELQRHVYAGRGDGPLPIVPDGAHQARVSLESANGTESFKAT